MASTRSAAAPTAASIASTSEPSAISASLSLYCAQQILLRLGKKTQLPLRLSTVTYASVKLTAAGPMRQANFPAPADLKAGERFPEYITEVEAKKGDV